MKNRRVRYAALAVFIFLAPLATLQAFDPPGLSFVENKGQWESSSLYEARIPGGFLRLNHDKLVFTFVDVGQSRHDHYDENAGGTPTHIHEFGDAADWPIKGHRYEMSFLGSNENAYVSGARSLITRYNYFLGKDTGQWATNARAFQTVMYQDLYPGIDMELYSQGQNLKYDLRVGPDTDPSQIRIRYQGVEELRLHQGNLKVVTSLSEVIEKRPYAYQVVDGKRYEIACEYLLKEDQLSFAFPNGYDPCYDLVIDPLLIFSTYSGSTADNWGNTATFDDAGNLYSAGITTFASGASYPVTPGAFQVNNQGVWDVSITKYDSAGIQQLYATYLGGSSSEVPQSLVVNNNNELVLMGVTSSPDFPTALNAYQPSFQGGIDTTLISGVDFNNGSDIFLTVLSTDGSSLVGSTFLGGADNDGIMVLNDPLTQNYGDQSRGDVFTDMNDNILIASKTNSTDFPILGGFQSQYAGGTTDAIVAKFNPDLSALQWSSYLGGSAMDAAYSIKINSNGEVLLTGGTNSRDLDSVHTSFNTSFHGDIDAWVAKVSPDGSTLVQGTFIGTAVYDQAYFLDLDADDNVYVFGQTSGVFPIVGNVYAEGGGQFLQKLNSSLDTVLFSTEFGNANQNPDISPTAFLVNECNNLYLSGWGGVLNNQPGYIGGSTTAGLPTTSDAFQSTTSESDFYLMVLTHDASELLYATYLGGTLSRTHVDGGTSRFDKQGIVYHAVCAGCAGQNITGRSTSDFPSTPGAWSRTNNSPNCNNAAFKFDLASLRARLQTNSIDLDMPGLDVVCLPDSIVFQNRSIGGEIYEWDLGDGTQITKTDTLPIIHLYPGPGQYEVKLVAIDQNTCAEIDSTMGLVTVFQNNISVIDDQTICEEDRVALSAFEGTSFRWESEDGSFRSQDQVIVVSPTDSTKYFIEVMDGNGCMERDSVMVNVIPRPDISYELMTVNDCIDRPELQFRHNTTEADQVIWNFGDGQTSDLDEGMHRYQQDGNYNVTFSVVREFCVFQESQTFPVITTRIPNVFTPAVSEGKNDFFVVEAGAARVDLKIYNRWGKLVLEKNDYQNDWNGNEVAAGVYYYDVLIENQLTCQGWVQILR